ncbi:PQQ-dependent sugar dehydrogenase [Sandaracinus amylolyticus]|uniref:Glucose/Sorbosone dehydrogenase domain-containing protein n=1 Tax=Sandaracinus amylolyticus TaxID=927083 RepID=A0A0F6W7A4_9BACT|nr:PQQ-dependent sugar dehydrogenase [Sandaracinus amylolyticus]AKF09223.1 hypothetical protein DB32_006372 [Sandaracinus amylolyticus]
MRTRSLLTLSLALALTACGGDDDGPVGPVDPWMEFTPLQLPEGTMPLVGAAVVPGTDDEMILLEILGTVRHVRIEEDTVTELGSFTITLEDGCSLLSTAFDPDYETNHFLYVGQCTTVTGSEIVRYTFAPPDYESVVASAQRIYFVDEPMATRAWHQVGSIGFFDDGSMWALFGEQLRSANAQDVTNDLGKILRIVPSRDPAMGGSTPSPLNPFASGGGDESPNVWTWGVRSPFRGALDASGNLWVADVGENTWEEINVVTGPGQNLGWPVHEGLCRELDCDDFVQPIVSWSHTDDHRFVLEDEETENTTKRNAYVGLEYQPRNADQYGGRLTGRMIYGDMCAGWVRSVQRGSDGRAVADRFDGHRPYISQWIQGGDDMLYVTTLGLCDDPGAGPLEPAGLWRVSVAE